MVPFIFLKLKRCALIPWYQIHHFRCPNFETKNLPLKVAILWAQETGNTKTPSIAALVLHKLSEVRVFISTPPRPGGLRGETGLREVSLGRVFEKDVVWSNYDDFTRPRPISGKSRLVKYYNLARCCCCKLAASWMMSRAEWRHHYKVGPRIVINGVRWHL